MNLEQLRADLAFFTPPPPPVRDEEAVTRKALLALIQQRAGEAPALPLNLATPGDIARVMPQVDYMVALLKRAGVDKLLGPTL